jgi:RHS repeat-associated protein
VPPAKGALGPSLLGTGDMDTMQAHALIRVQDTFMALPLACLLSAASAHSSIFTGKERDTESGNDYFGARYYASTMGRFMSPDWSVKQDPVPYAKLDNPQSLNLYAYVLNNPMTGRDPDGHVCWFGIGNTCVPTQKPSPPPTPDPAHVRPPNDHRVGPATGSSTPQTASKPKGLTIGAGISGNADAGVGVAGAEANGGYYKVASVNTKGQVQVSDALSGGTVAYAGSHTAGAPDQSSTSPLVAGAYAGVGLSGLIANTSTTGDLSGPFSVTQFNIPLVSVQVANDTSGDWVMSFTIGPSTPTASVFNMTTTTRVDCEVGCN